MTDFYNVIQLFYHKYNAESLCDIERDISEALQEKYNHMISKISKDENSFSKGTFEVSIVWHPND